MRCDIERVELDAYHDGALPAARARELHEHLAGCARCRATLGELEALSRRLRAELPVHAAPDVLRARIHAALREEAATRAPAAMPRRLGAGLAAAMLLVAAASSGVTYAVTSRAGAERQRADEVVASHVRSLMPNHLIDVASSDQHNVKPWFNGRVDLSPPVPSLAADSFPLAGGRLDYLAGRPVAAVVYMARRHVINVYSWPEPGDDTPPATRSANGYHLAQWRTNGVATWAVSDVNPAELARFVALYRARGGA